MKAKYFWFQLITFSLLFDTFSLAQNIKTNEVTATLSILRNKIGADEEILKSDTFADQDSTPTFEPPRLYINSNLLVGTEIIDPLQPKKFFTRATQLWKTDIRIGLIQPIGKSIDAFLSIRDNDSPHTNEIRLYEAGVKIRNDLGMFWFGQRRFQAGSKSYYLNDAFDRSFWDQGLIYDFQMRGFGISANIGKSQAEIFMGAETAASFIGGVNYGLQILPWWKTKASALYIARDPKYSAFGGEFGIELEESPKHFFGYQVIAYKVFDQEPSPFRELTMFGEVRYISDSGFDFGVAGLLRRLMDIGPNQDELRGSFDIKYRISKHVMPGIQAELFDIANFREIHVGVMAALQYFDAVRIIPRVRYVITEFGPNIGYFGIEGRILWGEWE